MVKKDVLKYFVLECIQSVEECIRLYKKDKNPERLHRLRVEIKKIKAIFSFASFVYQKKYKGTYIRPLFRDAGEIRELQINTATIGQWQGFPKKIISDWRNRERVLQRAFVKNVSANLKMLGGFREEFSFPDELPDKKTIKKYFKRRIKKAKKEVDKKEGLAMHDFRKQIKELLYVYDFLPKKIRNKIKLDRNGIDKLQEKTGAWHDTYTAVDFLSRQPVFEGITQFMSKLEKKEKTQFAALVSGSESMLVLYPKGH